MLAGLCVTRQPLRLQGNCGGALKRCMRSAPCSQVLKRPARGDEPCTHMLHSSHYPAFPNLP